MKRLILAGFSLVMLALTGCDSGPKPIELGKDNCDFCKMSIADKNYGAEILTRKGKVFKFDDTHCMASFRSQKMDSNQIQEVYFVNFLEPHNFIKSSDALLLKSDELHSPMGGNTAAFDNEAALDATNQKVHGQKISLQQLYTNL